MKKFGGTVFHFNICFRQYEENLFQIDAIV